VDDVCRGREIAAALTQRATIALVVVAACAYAGILLEARSERAKVVDTVVYAGRLASDGFAPFNTVFQVNDGSAAVGINYRFHASARWQIVPLPAERSATQWLSITADEPQFFAPGGYVRIYADGRLVGEIRARAQDTSGRTFAADAEPETILVPPERTLGYRFRLADGRCSVAPCRLSVDAFETFWHIFRFSVTGENAHFARPDSSSAKGIRGNVAVGN